MSEIHRRVAALRSGEDAALVARLPSGWVVLGDPQVLEGYCLLLPDPVVPHLNALEGDDRSRFLADLGVLGDALLAVTRATRINYAIFGNLEPALHAHLFPRRASEPPAQRAAQPFALDWAGAPRFDLGLHGGLRDELARALAAMQRR